MNLITKSGRLSRILLLIVTGLILLTTGGICVGQGEKAPSAQVESDVPQGSVLTLNWDGISGDLFNTIIYLRLRTVADGYSIGPYEAFVREDGSARIGIDAAYDPSKAWTVYYWIDINNNQSCEEDGADFVRQYNLTPGARSATLNHTLDTAPGGLCGGALYGFSNYEPQN